jgi:hypothetical protein
MVDYVAKSHEPYKASIATRKGKANAAEWFRHVQTVLVDALWVHYFYGDSKSIYVNRDTNRAKHKKPPKRYAAVGIKATRLVDAVDALKEAGMLDVCKPGEREPEYFKASGLLLKLAADTGFEVYNHFGRAKTEKVEMWEFRKPKGGHRYKELVDYADTENTSWSRGIVEALVDLMERTEVTLPNGLLVPPATFEKVKRQYHRQPGARHKRRADETYGRMHGWWQSYPEAQRLAMLFNGKPVAEVDIRSSILQTAYFLATGAQMPHADGYTTELVEISPHWRSLMKQLGVRATNTASKSACIHSMSRYLANNPMENSEVLGAGFTVDNLVTDFESLHSPFIGKWLFTKRGKELMWHESEVMLRTVSKLVAIDIPVLPTHDSYLVPFDMVDITKRALVTSFNSLYGIEITDAQRLLKVNSLSLGGRESEREAPSPPSSLVPSGRHPLTLQGQGGYLSVSLVNQDSKSYH